MIFGFFFEFFLKISVLEVEIGKNGPGILGVNGGNGFRTILIVPYNLNKFFQIS
jgi:hypothetical protein